MVDSSLGRPLFDEALEAIQHTILEQHRQDFQSNVTASLLLDEIHRISTSNGLGDQRIVASTRKFSLFIRTFTPYFGVLSTCVEVRPEWVGWFWGTVRLVFKTSSYYPLFLEKIADMFEAIAHTVPSYQRIYEVCKHITPSSHIKTEDFSLAALMSYVHADLVQFCLELYQMFCRGTQGISSRHLTLEATQATQWRPLDYRFSRLETRIAHHRRWLEKETADQIQQYADVAQHRRMYVSYLHSQDEVNSNGHVENEDQRVAKRLRRVEKVQHWLSGSSAANASDRILELQQPNSCAWFLKTQAYCRWRDPSFGRNTANDKNTLESNWQHRVLFVQAKAGFGKTCISRSVIDDLVAEAEDLELCDEPPTTAFFQFGCLLSKSSHPEDAFRSMACQLLRSHQHDCSTLDVVCLLLRKTSFQEHAINEEVLDVLSILLRQHPTFIVIDGIDECSDSETFFTSLARLCRGSDTRVMIFSRPNIKIPLEYQKWASDAPHILTLTSKHNASAIQQHLVYGLSLMADQGFFGISMDRSLIAQAAQSTNDVFLWASMLLNFLQTSVLTSAERLAILRNIQSLEGLEALHRVMLKALARRTQHEKRVIADVIRWLSFPIHRMCPAALRAALSTHHPDAPEATHVTEIMDALPELTCGLIQSTNDTISFAHRSIREYLQSPLSQDSEFSIHDGSSVHAHLAARCLSYLTHDVPKRPLSALRPHSLPMLPVIPSSSGASQRTSASEDSGYKSLSSSDGDNNTILPMMPAAASNTRPNSIRIIPFDTHLPFLRYAALCWPIHLSRALSPSSHSSGTTSTYETLAYLPSLAAFLSSRLAVTVWVESSFRYDLPPTLTRLIGPLADLKAEIPPSTVEGRELRRVVSKMRDLSERLVGLKRECEGVFRQNPSLLWQVDGPGESYWPVWEEILASGNQG